MSDLISRQAAIDALDFEIVHMTAYRDGKNEGNPLAQYNKGLEDGKKAIENLPSAQPEIIHCGECKHMMPNGKCRQFADSTIRPSASDFCSAGERKDNARFNQQTGGD